MAIKQINDEARAREKAAREVAGPKVDPEIEKRRNAAEKAREASITRMNNFEIRAGQTSLEHRKKYLADLEAITSTADKRTTERTKHMISALETEYRKNTANVIEQHKIEKTQEDKLLKDKEDRRKKNEDAVRRHNQSIEQMRKDSLGRVERSEIQAGASHIQARRRYMQRLEDIIQTSNQRSLEDTREMIRLIEAEYAKINRMELAGARTGRGYTDISDRTRNMSRQVNVMFNVQQAIEDFSFAGMRGASNNLAAMAATLGGPAGIIAMLGLAGYSLYNIGKDMKWFGDKVEETTKSIANQIQTLKELREASRQRELGFSGRGFGSSRSQMFERAKDVELFRRELASLNSDAKRFTAIDEELRGFLAPMKDPRTTPIKGGMGGAALDEARLKEIEKFYAKRERAIEFLKENRDIFGDVDVDTFYESYKENLELVKEFQQEAENNAKLKQQEIEDTKEQIRVLKEYIDVEKQIDSIHKSMESKFSGVTGLDDLPLVKKSLEENRDLEKSQLDWLQEQIDSRKEAIELLQAQGREKEALDNAKELAEWVLRQKTIHDDSYGAARRLYDLFSNTYSIVKDTVAQTDRLAQSTERAAKAAWERVKALKAEKQSGQFSFESAVFGAQNTIIGKQAEEALEQRRNMLGSQDNYLKRDEMMVKFMFGDNERTRKLIQERAKVISKQYEYALKSIEDTVDWQRRVRANTLLDERIDVLKDRSAGQAKGGDFKGSIESLSEVQNLLLGAMGNAGTSTQMTAFLNRAKKIQDEIDKMHDRNIQRETERADKAQQMADQARELRDNAVKTKEAIESLDPNANGAMDRLLEMQLILEKMRTDAESMEALFEAQQNVPVAMNSPLPNFMAGNAGRPGGMSNTNVTNITVGSVNTAATSANSLATDIYSKAKRQGIMMS